MVRTGVVTGFALVVVSLGLSGCAGGVDGPVLTSQPGPVGAEGFGAGIQGAVQLDGDCLVLGNPDEPAGGPHFAVIWPAGTRWQAEPPAVVLPDGTHVPMGGRVSGGGGVLQPEELGLGADVVAAAADCVDDTGQVAVFNPGSEVTAPDSTEPP